MSDSNEKINKIVEEVSILTALELSQLVKAFEVKFGVSAAAPVAMAAVGAQAAGGEAAAAVKSSFDVILASAGASKIPVIKVVREITGLGLKEAKDLVDGAPKAVKQGVGSEEAEKIKAQLTAAGATVELK